MERVWCRGMRVGEGQDCSRRFVWRRYLALKVYYVREGKFSSPQSPWSCGAGGGYGGDGGGSVTLRSRVVNDVP